MKNFYIAIQQKYNNNKFFAYTIKVNSSDNLLSKLKNSNIICANLCETKKKAEETVDLWNESFIENGTFLFEKNYKNVIDYRKAMNCK